MSSAPGQTSPVEVDLVIPTVGRPSLRTLLEALADADGPPPGRIVLADDRVGHVGPLLDGRLPERIAERVEVVRSGGRGPAAARNAGWRRSAAEWIAFLDDDVLPPGDWLRCLHADLAELPDDVAASQAKIRVPLPTDRRPTDWERNVAGLETARWATADMAYRREVLVQVGGFDERFPRAFREDADLGLRVTRAGYRIVRGDREMVHPVRPADDRVSIRMQAGNAEDPLMRALHGPDWRTAAGVPRGRRPWHLATTAAAALSLAATVVGRRRLATAAAATWAALTADFAWRRTAPGPRTGDEIRRMASTSVVLPFAATAHWLRGVLTLPRRLRAPGPRADAEPTRLPRPESTAVAVLFDRDGTLIHDVPYNGDPGAVRPVDGAREALDRLRAAGIPTAVISNQSGVGRGLVTVEQVEAVNDRVEELLGPLGPWLLCTHTPEDGCDCRKPAPTLVEQAAERLGVDPRDCVVVGDIGSDVEAALAAGARAILVPTAVTREEEVLAAPEVAVDLSDAIDRVLGTTAHLSRRGGDAA